jgi:hypothetical protein
MSLQIRGNKTNAKLCAEMAANVAAIQDCGIDRAAASGGEHHTVIANSAGRHGDLMENRRNGTFPLSWQPAASMIAVNRFRTRKMPQKRHFRPFSSVLSAP